MYFVLNSKVVTHFSFRNSGCLTSSRTKSFDQNFHNKEGIKAKTATGLFWLM